MSEIYYGHESGKPEAWATHFYRTRAGAEKAVQEANARAVRMELSVGYDVGVMDENSLSAADRKKIRS